MEESSVSDEGTIDLSNKSLKKLEKIWRDDDNIESVLLDQNELSSLENIGSISSLKTLSASRNRIRRMSTLPPLTNLCSLDLSNNNIVCIEGLKHGKLLRHLNLSGNYIKAIDHLSNNLELEYIDLSDNAIGHVTDLSFLIKLKELYLHKNHLSHLRQCDKYLPKSLEILTLSDNNIGDLAEVSHLEDLTNLKELTFKGNPCLELAQGKPGFNYRPYLKIWCLNLTTVDGSPLNPLESLKSEWLYSQGRGRRFRPGEHAALVDYLMSACPLVSQNVGSDDEKKLRLILSKAEEHQQQLKSQIASGIVPAASRIRRNGHTDRMVSSYHDTVSRDSMCASPDMMTRSLDCSVLRNSPPSSIRHSAQGRSGSPLQAASVLVPVPESLVSPDVCRPLHPLLTQSLNRNTRSPLATPPSNRTVSPQSTPGSKRRTPNNSASPGAGRRISPAASPKSRIGISTRIPRCSESEVADNEDSEMSAHKLQKIQLRASQKRNKESRDTPPPNAKPLAGKSTYEKKLKVAPQTAALPSSHLPGGDVWRAALCIQRRWRGYRTRNLDAKVVAACKTIQANRMQEYIIKVAEDMEATKAVLEGNRKLQVLQMQAINAMWRKMSTSELEGLATSCLHLTQQVEELRGLVSGLQAGAISTPPPAIPIATQTDIVAVHTPQGDAQFPYPLRRPNQLEINDSGNAEGPIISEDVNSDVCWTPACQEGKDLQSLQTSMAVPAAVGDGLGTES